MRTHAHVNCPGRPNEPSPLSRFARSAGLLALAIAVLAACQTAPPPKVARASGKVAAMPLLVSAPPTELGQTLAAAIETELGRAGFRIVGSEDNPHDAVVALDVNVREETGLVKIYVDGEVKTNRVATVTLRVVADGVTLETAQSEFDADEPVPEPELQRLAAAVANSASLRVHARNQELRRKHAAKAEQHQAEQRAAERREKEHAAREKAAQEETAAWSQIVLTECIQPEDVDACDALKAFLEQYPTGKHAPRAKRALETGTKKIADLVDERDWTNANASACENPETSSDCDGVAAYLVMHPTGAHVEEAKGVLEGSRDNLDNLKAREERAHARELEEQKRAEMRDRQAACKQDCKVRCFSSRYHTTCMNRCYSTFCNELALRDEE